MFNNLLNILASAEFNTLLCGGIVKTAEINALITLLIAANIPYNLVFSPSNGRFAKEAVLTIFITPSINLSFIIQYEAGQIAIT